MILLDANILIYAYAPGKPQHEPLQRWLAKAINTEPSVAIPWVSIWAMIRILTNPRITNPVLPTHFVFEVINDLLSQSNVVALDTTRRHLSHLADAMEDGQIYGSETTDAVLAAIAIEHGATLVSTDTGFRRFRKLKLLNPLEHPIK